MDWIRWHHGAITDPKFQLISRRSGQSLPTVLAVWAALLERASQADERGSIEGFDCESLNALFGLADGTCESIVAEFEVKGMIADGFVANWDKRQKGRKSTASGSSGSSTQRVREYRARQKSLITGENYPPQHDATPCNSMKRDVTPCNALQHDVTQGNVTKHGETPQIRLDKRREEKTEELLPGAGASATAEPEVPALLAPVISLPLNTGPEHPVTQSEIEQWADLYPAVDVPQELRNMRGWLLGNPKKRKTKGGIGRFIQAWLAKEQDKGPGVGVAVSPRASPDSPASRPSLPPLPPEPSPEERRKTAANALKMHAEWKRKNALALTGGRESHDSTCISA